MCRTASEPEKRGVILKLMAESGEEHVMQGRMSSMIHSTLRGVASKQSRYQNESVGWNQEKKKKGMFS